MSAAETPDTLPYAIDRRSAVHRGLVFMLLASTFYGVQSELVLDWQLYRNGDLFRQFGSAPYPVFLVGQELDFAGVLMALIFAAMNVRRPSLVWLRAGCAAWVLLGLADLGCNIWGEWQSHVGSTGVMLYPGHFWEAVLYATLWIGSSTAPALVGLVVFRPTS